MAHAQSLTLHHVLTRGGHVNQQVNQMVFQQIDFVDIQKATVRARQQPGLKGFDTLGQRTFQIKRTDDPVFGSTQRQVNHRHCNLVLRQGLLRMGPQCGAIGTRVVGPGRIATVAATDDRIHLGKQRCQCSNGRGFARATVTENQYAAHAGVDGRHQNGKLHFVLGHDC